MRVIVAGSRNYTDKDFIYSKLDYFLSEASNVEIIEGGCRGVDLIARQYAIDRNLPYKEFPANWEIYGKKAGPIRNRKMAEYADALIAFYNGSKGTENMIEIARNKGLAVRIVPIKQKGC